MMAMSYGYVYVAQIAMAPICSRPFKAIKGSGKNKRAVSYYRLRNLLYHGIKSGMGTSLEQQKKAVEAGYWHLSRYNPERKQQGNNPFIMDSKAPKGNFREFLESEIRYSSLMNVFPDIADDLFKVAEEHAMTRYETYRRMAENDCFR
jgi:pyruvate-ferredoxin/flavodoxin oxidoreductase